MRASLSMLLLGAAGLLLLWNELLSFAWSAWSCALTPNQTEDAVVVLVVSDVHVLGRERNPIDSWWTSYGLLRSFTAISLIIQPDVTVVLGDHLDRGGKANLDDFRLYAASFKALTRHRRGIFIASVIGNHDYRAFDAEQLERFEAEFGRSNSIIRKVGAKYTFVTVNSMELMDPNVKKSSTREFVSKFRLRNNASSTTILLSHVAMYRYDDSACGSQRTGEGKGVTYNHPLERNIVGVDVLSQEATDFLLQGISPRLILSGHTHAACVRTMDNGVVDVTVPTFSWRMRPDAGYAVVRLQGSGETFRVESRVCGLPNEHVMFFRYAVALFLITASIVWKLCGVKSKRE